jgi:hypothetical protein
MGLETKTTGKEQWKHLSTAGRLFAVVDSCDEPSVPKKVRELGPERAVSLYRGGAEEQYAAIAPYLVHADQSVFEWIEKDLWRAPWGIFAYSDASLEALRTHFRRFLKVKSTDQKEYLFRFYDPRILPPFLKSSDEAELKQFFGPVQAFGATEGEAVHLLQLRGGRA